MSTKKKIYNQQCKCNKCKGEKELTYKGKYNNVILFTGWMI